MGRSVVIFGLIPKSIFIRFDVFLDLAILSFLMQFLYILCINVFNLYSFCVISLFISGRVLI